MRRLAKNLIVYASIFSLGLVANFSLNSCCEQIFLDVAYNSDENNNSEFWKKFRESVMPDDNNKGKIPNYEKNPPPPEKPSRNKAM